MMVHSHLLFGVVCWTGTVSCLSLKSLDLLVWGTLVLGVLSPDIDHPRSFLGRRLPFISLPFSRRFGHRGITHAWLAIALMMLLGYVGYRENMPALLAFAIGYLSHLLGDWLTVGGIPLAWPIKTRFRAPFFFATGKSGEYLLDVILAVSWYWMQVGHWPLWLQHSPALLAKTWFLVKTVLSG